MTSSRQSGPLVASALALQSQHELARRSLVMGLVQAWVHASLASRYARFLEQSSEHSLTAILTCPASWTKMALSTTTDASHTCHGSLILGSAWPNPGAAKALMSRSRRLHRLAGYDANAVVACVRGPTIADTSAIQ
ncbi:hypothetical protein BJX68DRAFT_210801 [Aspergillus pseudodeflectus]|uniref:Uncharacterized protein n=1 Tax=Aspergillus pseudodeflectus TaxID=176178 RepID=A0ABR4JF87_9EURO